MLEFKLFDIYTGKWRLRNPNDPKSVLVQKVENTLLEKILPPEAANKLSVAKIEIGMEGEEIANSHPEPGMVLLLAKGDRGIYGPPEYKQLLQPYLDLAKDYPYHRYLANENVNTITRKVKVWVVEDEEGISGVDGVSSDKALSILGDSHGKISTDLADSFASSKHLLQYRAIGVDNPFFAKGTFQASLQNTLKSNELDTIPELEGIDMILPTSSIKGASKSNLPPGVHEIDIHLANHEESSYKSYTLRSVLEKMDGDFLTSSLKQQQQQIEKQNELFGDSDKFYQEFIKFLEPKTIKDPENPNRTIPFDPENWEKCEKWDYIAFRKDYESGHHQLLNSPIYASRFKEFYASRARDVARLKFVKVKGGMIAASHNLKNDEICVPYLKEGEKVAAIRSPIIQLPDIALATNKLIRDRKNDNGELVEGMILCSPQIYEQYVFQTRTFMREWTRRLEDYGIDVKDLEQLNPFNFNKFKDRPLSTLNAAERKEFTVAANFWREQYNNSLKTVAINSEIDLGLKELEVLRLDTFTSIIKGDFDGDNIAILPQSQYPTEYEGIKTRILRSDDFTEKLDKIKLNGTRELSETLAIKANPYILGITANLAEFIQSYALESERLQAMGTKEQKEAYLRQIAPVFYYLMANPTVEEIKEAEAVKLPATYRFYIVSSTESRLIDPQLVAKFDVYGISAQLKQIYQKGAVSEASLDRMSEVWQDLLYSLNSTIAQQNQIAVDNFKSERDVDHELIEGLTNRFKIIDDKLKSQLDNKDTYRIDLPNVSDSTSNRALLTQNVNQNLVNFDVNNATYYQIQNLFPEVNDLNIKQECYQAISKNNLLKTLAWRYRSKSRIDKGSSMVFTDKYDRKIEITNLQGSGHTPAKLKAQAELSGKPLEIYFRRNQDPNASHKMTAFYLVDGNPEQLGTVCNASHGAYEFKDNETFEVDKLSFDFVTPGGEYEAELFNEQSRELIKDFRKQAEDSGRLFDYAAITHQILTNNKDTDYMSSSTYNFMFDAFGPEVVERLSSLQMSQLKMNFLTNNIPLNQGDTIAITIDRDLENDGKLAVFTEDENREKVKIGSLEQNSFQPKLGTAANATVNIDAPHIGVFTLPDGSTFQIGKMAASQAAGMIFDNEEVEVEIGYGKPTQTPIFKVNNNPIGSLSKDSYEYLKSIKFDQKSRKFKLKLNLSGKDKGLKINAVAPDGKTLEIVNVAKYSTDLTLFDGRELDVELDYLTSSPPLEAYVYKQGQRLQVGEFTFNRGKDRQLVKSLNLIDSEPFKARLTTQSKVINLDLDLDTVEYPAEPINRFSEVTNIDRAKDENPTTESILKQQLSYRAIANWTEREWSVGDSDELRQLVQLDSLDLVIDRDKSELVESYLKSKDLDFQLIDSSNSSVALETRKGFVVYSIPAALVNRETYNQLKTNLDIGAEFDSYYQGEIAIDKYRSYMSDRFKNVESIEEAKPEASLSNNPPRFPIFDNGTSVESPEYPSVALLKLITEPEFLTPAQRTSYIQQLDRFDLAWIDETIGDFYDNIAVINSYTSIDAVPSGDSRIDAMRSMVDAPYLQQYFMAYLDENDWSTMAEVVGEYLTPEAELVYQHSVAATDARYKEELKAVLGKEKYEFYQSRVKELIAANITPKVIDSTFIRPVEKLSAAPKNVRIPFPETLTRGQESPIELGTKDSKISLALANPQETQFEDTAYPIEYEGTKYASVQQAYLNISNLIPEGKESYKQLYALTSQLMELKLVQHPQLRKEIEDAGGVKWLNSCSFNNKNEFWSGTGRDSAYIKLLVKAYKNSNSEKTTAVSSSTNNPVQIAKDIFPVTNSSVNLSPYSKDPLAAALSLPTCLANYKKNTDRQYTINFRDNPYRPAKREGNGEKYFRNKYKGRAFESAADVYEFYSAEATTNDEKSLLLTQILTAKLEQYPHLAEGIAMRGGVEWLNKCSANFYSDDKFLEGKGTDSGVIKAYVAAYEAVLAKGLVVTRSSSAVVSTASSPATEAKSTVLPANNRVEKPQSTVKNNSRVIRAEKPVEIIGDPRSPLLTPEEERILYSEDDYELESAMAFEPEPQPEPESIEADLNEEESEIEWVTASEEVVKGIQYNSKPIEVDSDYVRIEPPVRESANNNEKYEISLNEDQTLALDGLVQFALSKNEEKYALLVGSAGTGKTFTVQQFLKTVKATKPNLKIGFCAPTHAAVSVLGEMAKSSGVEPDKLNTLASVLGLQPVIDEKTGVQTFKIPKDRDSYFLPDILVVDEASMIGTELWGHLQEAAIRSNSKILLMGDKIQLPPVGELASPIFEDPQILSSYKLDKVMRYDGDVMVSADAMRHQVEKIQAATDIDSIEKQSDADFPIFSSQDGQIITSTGSNWEQAVVAEFLTPEYKADPNHFKVVAYTNSRTRELNQKIRTAIHGRSDLPEYLPGDVAISLSTVKGKDRYQNDANLNTSENFVIESARSATDVLTGYKVWQLSGHSLSSTKDGEYTDIPKITVLASESKEKFRKDLQLLKQKAIKSRNGADWREYYGLKEKYPNVDYGYAITAHRSQGSTFNKVAIDRNNFEIRMGHYKRQTGFVAKKQALQEYYQLLYVALTRAKAGVMIADDLRVQDLVFDDEIEITQPKMTTSEVTPSVDNLEYEPQNTTSVPTMSARLKDLLLTASSNSDIWYKGFQQINDGDRAFLDALILDRPEIFLDIKEIDPDERNDLYQLLLEDGYELFDPYLDGDRAILEENSLNLPEFLYPVEAKIKEVIEASSVYQNFLKNEKIEVGMEFGDYFRDDLNKDITSIPGLSEIKTYAGDYFPAFLYRVVDAIDNPDWEVKSLGEIPSAVSQYIDKAIEPIAGEKTFEVASQTSSVSNKKTVKPTVAQKSKPSLRRLPKLKTKKTTQNEDVSSAPGVQLAGAPTPDISPLTGVQETPEDISRSIQDLGCLDDSIQEAILTHLETMKSELDNDVSRYAKGRQRFWLGTEWNLKDKTFETSGKWNSQLWELCNRVYPDVDMALITYSGDEGAAGIDMHRDDSYADFEARSISIETIKGAYTDWSMKQSYPGMNWTSEQNKNAPQQDFSLPSGSIISFNCKNPHAASPGAGRWSINLWKVSAKQKEAFNEHIAKHGISGGAKDYAAGLQSIPLPPAMHLTSELRASLSAPPLSESIEPVAVTPVQSPIKKPGVAMITFENEGLGVNLNEFKITEAQAKTRLQISEILAETGTKAQVLDTVKVWEDENYFSQAASGTIANFKTDDIEVIKYNTAKIGLSTEQNRISYFIEDENGNDALYSFTSDTDNLSEIKDNLEMFGFDRFTLMPSSKGTKILIYDRGAENTDKIKPLTENYGKPKLFQGTAGLIKQSEYASIISNYEAKTRSASRGGSGVESNHQQLQQGNNSNPVIDGLQSGSISRLEARRKTLECELREDSVEAKAAKIATKFIGYAIDNNDSVAKLVNGWDDLANGSDYSPTDIIHIDGPALNEANRETVRDLFNNKYKPLLDKAIATKAKFIMEDKLGIGKLALKHLQRNGYVFKDSKQGFISAYQKQLSVGKLSTPTNRVQSHLAASLLKPRIENNAASKQDLIKKGSSLMAKILNASKAVTYQDDKYRFTYDASEKKIKLYQGSSNIPIEVLKHDENQWSSLHPKGGLTQSIVDDFGSILNNLTSSERDSHMKEDAKVKQEYKPNIFEDKTKTQYKPSIKRSQVATAAGVAPEKETER